MLRNGVNAQNGVIAFMDVVQLSEQQGKKKHDVKSTAGPGDKGKPTMSNLPSGKELGATVAEVLRQAEGGRAKKGGWVGGDAWFGQVMSCVELYIRLGLCSTFVVKGYTHLFPKLQLLAVLKARYPTNMAGHWVVMETDIAGVHLIAVACAWSKKNVTCMVSTCGRTTTDAHECIGNCEDEHGQAQQRKPPRPELCGFLFDKLPQIDAHNKDRQSQLALERAWPIKEPEFRLVTTLVGMGAVDMHRMCAAHDCNRHGQMTIKEFANLIVGEFEERHQCQAMSKRCIRCDTAALDEPQLVPPSPEHTPRGGLQRVKSQKTGSSTKRVTPTQKSQGTNSKAGSGAQATCHVCRKCYGPQQCVFTTFKCVDCGTPLCKKDRTEQDDARVCSCIHEHKNSLKSWMRCKGAGGQAQTRMDRRHTVWGEEKARVVPPWKGD